MAFWKSSSIEAALKHSIRTAWTAEAEQVTKEVAQVEEKKKHVVTKVGAHRALSLGGSAAVVTVVEMGLIVGP